jgi:hypothetical protein
MSLRSINPANNESDIAALSLVRDYNNDSSPRIDVKKTCTDFCEPLQLRRKTLIGVVPAFR